MEARRRRVAVSLIFAATALAAGAACVDLFHATDFPTLCAEDAAACAESGVDADLRDTKEPPPPTAVDLCASDSTAALGKAQHACAYLGACLGTPADHNFSQCMLQALAAFDCKYNPTLRPTGKTATLWDCLSNAKSCDETALCVFNTPAPGCTSGGYTGCNADGGVAVVECGDAGVVGMNPCMLGDQTCARVDDSNSRCVGAVGLSCTPNDDKPHCAGNAVVACKIDHAIHFDDGIDCAAFGSTCYADKSGAGCAPSPTVARTPCSGDSEVTCFNDRANSCINGQNVTFDCSAIGLACVKGSAGPNDPASACTNPDAGATCTTTEDSCTGTNGSLRSCFRNVVFETPCTTLGLGKCTTRPNGRPSCSAPAK